MKHTILVVDDDDLILRALGNRFSTRQITVLTAKTPETAKEILEKYKPELMLLDILLTSEDGAQSVLDYMKSRPELEHTTVLVLTNLDKPDLKQIFLAQGVKEYLIKGTINLDDLYNKVLEYLEPS